MSRIPRSPGGFPVLPRRRQPWTGNGSEAFTYAGSSQDHVLSDGSG